MTDYELMKIVAEALEYSSRKKFKNVLADDCRYHSDYAGVTILGKSKILSRMKEIDGNLTEADAYTCKVVEWEEVLCQGITDIPHTIDGEIAQKVVLMYQGDKHPAAAVYAIKNADGKIVELILSRDNSVFNLIFYKQEAGDDSELDIPKNLNEDNDDLYIWKKADEAVRDLFSQWGYEISDSQIFDDCIGYHTVRKEHAYTIYVYAFGKKKLDIDGEYCKKYLDVEFSKNSEVLVFEVHVGRYVDEDGYQYKVDSYAKTNKFEFWKIVELQGKYVFQYFPRKELIEKTDDLIFAFNNQYIDLLNGIFVEAAPKYEEKKGTFWNEGCFNSLIYTHKTHGDMRIGYMSYNKRIYCYVPYIPEYGFFSFTVSSENNDRIERLALHSFDEADDFIYTENTIDKLHVNVPRLVNVFPLPINGPERFTLQLNYDDGSSRWYKQHIYYEDEKAEVIRHCSHIFSDGIWKTVQIGEYETKKDQALYSEQCIRFVNDYQIPAYECFINSYKYNPDSKSIILDDLKDVFIPQQYSEDGFAVGRIGCFDGGIRKALYLVDKNEKSVRRLPEEYQKTELTLYHYSGGYTHSLIMVSLYGEMNLKYYHEFEDCAGLWGWIDRDFNVVIEPQYIFAQNFVDGKAIVAKGNWIKCEKEYDWENEAWGIIDTTGKEIIPCKYDDIHEIDGTDRLYLVHKNGWDNGTYAIYDIELSDEILQMDFDFDAGYMFNEMFVTEEDLLIFDEHLPGEGKDLITIYDLTKKTYIVYRDENTERTFNGEKTLSVNKDGKDIIIF